MDAVAAFSNQHCFDYCPVKVVFMGGFADFFKYAANLEVRCKSRIFTDWEILGDQAR